MTFRFNPKTSLETTPDDMDGTVVDCSMLVMADGKSHVLGNSRCDLVSLSSYLLLIISSFCIHI